MGVSLVSWSNVSVLGSFVRRACLMTSVEEAFSVSVLRLIN